MTGTVTNVTDFGLFLELEEGIEGLVHISEIAKDKRGNPTARFQVDDVIQAKVLNVSSEDKKIGLSIRKLEEGDDKEIFRSYLDNHKEATSNLGELLREEMMNLDRQAQSNDIGHEDAETSKPEPDTLGETIDNSSGEPPTEGADSENMGSHEVEESEAEPDTRDQTTDSSSEEPPTEGADSENMGSHEVEESEAELDTRDQTTDSSSGEPLTEGADSTK